MNRLHIEKKHLHVAVIFGTIVVLGSLLLLVGRVEPLGGGGGGGGG